MAFNTKPAVAQRDIQGAWIWNAEIFEKVNFDPYNFRITILSARKSEQMKNF